MTLPSTSTTSGTPINCIPLDWSQEEEASGKKKAISILHSRKPDVRWRRSGKSPIRSGQTQIRSVQKYLDSSTKCSLLVQFEDRSMKRIAVLSNSITCNHSFQHTTCDLYWEKVEDMKTGEELDCKVCQSPRLPRVVHSRNGRQDPPNPDARKSTDHQSEQRLYRETCRSLLEDTRREDPAENQRCLYRETCRGNVDYRIPGFPHSTVLKVDTNLKETVKRLIRQFENHLNWYLLLQDLNKTEEINPLTDMGNTEIVELYETSSKKHMRQMPAAYRNKNGNCKNYSGKMIQRRPIPKVFVKYWVDWRTNQTIWRTDIGRSLLRVHTWRKKSWKFSLNREALFQYQSINDLILLKQSRSAKDCTTNTLKELVTETDRSILHNKPDSDVINNSRASMSAIAQLITELDGNFTLQPDQQLRLRQRTGRSTTNKSWDSGRSSTWTEQELFPCFFSCSGDAIRETSDSCLQFSREGVMSTQSDIQKIRTRWKSWDPNVIPTQKNTKPRTKIGSFRSRMELPEVAPDRTKHNHWARSKKHTDAQTHLPMAHEMQPRFISTTPTHPENGACAAEFSTYSRGPLKKNLLEQQAQQKTSRSAKRTE